MYNINLSRNAKEAIKTALAMTIAYGIALSMDWDKPYWAGFSVAMVSLATVGQSINKAAMRLGGTLLAMFIALTLIALFAQERWVFILFLSIYASYCTYKMSGSRHAYFWHVSGFVSVIICIDGGPDSANAFQIAILRAQETGLGILVYTLVTIFLWPTRSATTFNRAVTDLADTQHQYFRACWALMGGRGNTQHVKRLSAQQAQQKNHFNQLLDAAQTDSDEVWALRRSWQRYQQQAAQLIQSMERWRETFANVQMLDFQRLLPGITQYHNELDWRLAQIKLLLAGQVPTRLPKTVDVSLDADSAQTLSPFQRASVVVTSADLRHLEQLTRSLYEAASEFACATNISEKTKAPRKTSKAWVPDLDRLANVVRFLAIFWLVWLALIYVNDLPGGGGLVAMAAPLGMVVANMPQLPVSALFYPALSGVIFGAVLYIFVMPTLSSFIGLGLLIFAATFAICYRYATPQKTLGRLFGLVLFVTIAAISNEQHYSFLSVAATALMFPLIFLVFAITAYIPISLLPERVFMRLLGRFFHSGDYIISAAYGDASHPATRMTGWKQTFHFHEMATIPEKLHTWAPHINSAVLPGTTPQQVQALVASLQTLANHLQCWIDRRNSPQAEIFVQQLQQDFNAWRLGIQSVMQQLAQDPVGANCNDLRNRLRRVRERLEEKIEYVINNSDEGQLSEQDTEYFFHLLGAYRGVSEALIDYASNSNNMNWVPWRMERFA